MTAPRAAIVVTGTELVRGDRADLNGPFLARALHRLGIEARAVTIVGDRMDELEAAIRHGLEADLCLVSGGLGPTQDDRTMEAVARATGRELEVRADLHDEIEAVSRGIAERLRRPYAEFEAGVRKQASLPVDALSLGLAGTAPGAVMETDGCVVVVLPGPPSELRRLWAQALESQPVLTLLARATPPERRVLRFFGVSESAVAQALDEIGEGGEEVTVCARDFEIHVDLVGPGEPLANELRARLGEFLFAEDERTIAEIVLELCREQALTLATAESITGGLIGALLTAIPGSSDAFLGGVVAYSDDVKRRELDVPAEVLDAHGAVSAETAEAMAAGARARLGADVAVAVTGIAGPGGGSDEKPVGLVYLHAAGPDGGLARHFVMPGDRESIRRRSAASALHLVRRLLTQSRPASA